MANMEETPYFVRELDTKCGKTIKINQCETGDVGCVVWDAAIVLCSYLETPSFTDSAGESILRDKSIIELGSGTGVVGIKAAVLGSHVIVTDLEEFLPLLNLNIKTNGNLFSGRIKAETLKWGEEPHIKNKPDYILMADCIYYDESIKPLVKTLTDLCGPLTTIICCYEERTEGSNPKTEKAFFEHIQQHFNMEEVPLSDQDPIYRCNEIHVLKFTRKK